MSIKKPMVENIRKGAEVVWISVAVSPGNGAGVTRTKIIELWSLNVQTQVERKKLRATDREMTTPLPLLKAVQLDVHISEMELLTIGTINDMYCEMQQDEEPHAQIASQDDMDRF